MFLVIVEWLVGSGFDLGLALRFAASEFEAGDCFAREMDLAADASVRPGGIEREGVAELQHLAPVVGATDEDHRSWEWLLRIEGPLVGEGLSMGGVLDADGGALVDGLHEAVRLELHLAWRLEGEPLPDLLLPASVVGFVRGLKAVLARGSEHGDDTQLQTPACDATEEIGVSMRPLKLGPVVERHVARQAVSSPSTRTTIRP